MMLRNECTLTGGCLTQAGSKERVRLTGGTLQKVHMVTRGMLFSWLKLCLVLSCCCCCCVHGRPSQCQLPLPLSLRSTRCASLTCAHSSSSLGTLDRAMPGRISLCSHTKINDCWL